MVTAHTIICPICERKYLLRQQVDYSQGYEVPIRFHCKCGYLFKGNSGDDQTATIASFKEKKERPYQENTDSYISLSSDFPIPKTMLYNPARNLDFSPFFKCSSTFGIEKVMDHCQNFQKLLIWHHNYYDKLESIINIYERKDLTAFNNYLNQEFSNKKFQTVKTEKEARNNILLLLNDPFNTIITPQYLKIYASNIIEQSNDIIINNHSQIREMRIILDKHYELRSEILSGYHLLLNYLGKAKQFIPVMLLCNTEDYNKKYGDEFGIVTTTFDEVKHFYSENFEYISRLSSVVFGLYNMLEKDQDGFVYKPLDYNILEDYIALDNGRKKDKIATNTILDTFFGRTMDNQIRNGIGHYKTHYDQIKQLITYYPYKGKKGKEGKEIYLIDFCFLIIRQISTVYILMMLLFRFMDATSK